MNQFRLSPVFLSLFVTAMAGCACPHCLCDQQPGSPGRAVQQGGAGKDSPVPANFSFRELFVPSKASAPREIIQAKAVRQGTGETQVLVAAGASETMAPTMAFSADLAGFTDAWPSLSESVRRAMLALEPEFNSGVARLVDAWQKMADVNHKAMLALSPELSSGFTGDLARVTEAWPRLPDANRRAMLALEPEFNTDLAPPCEAWFKLPETSRRAMLALVESGK